MHNSQKKKKKNLRRTAPCILVQTGEQKMPRRRTATATESADRHTDDRCSYLFFLIFFSFFDLFCFSVLFFSFSHVFPPPPLFFPTPICPAGSCTDGSTRSTIRLGSTQRPGAGPRAKKGKYICEYVCTCEKAHEAKKKRRKKKKKKKKKGKGKRKGGKLSTGKTRGCLSTTR